MNSSWNRRCNNMCATDWHPRVSSIVMGTTLRLYKVGFGHSLEPFYRQHNHLRDMRDFSRVSQLGRKSPGF